MFVRSQIRQNLLFSFAGANLQWRSQELATGAKGRSFLIPGADFQG